MADIQGYPKLDEHEIFAINSVKTMEVKLANLMKQLQANEDLDLDQRWMAIAKTDLQKAFMTLVRAIAKPEDVF